MDDDTRNLTCGCIGVFLVVLLIWIGFRSHTFGQFLAMAGIAILGCTLALLGVGALLSGSGWWLILFLAVPCLYSVGTFMFTGNYALSMQRLGITAKATPVANVAATAAPTSTPLPTATLTPPPTATPRPTFTPVPLSANTPVAGNTGSSTYPWANGASFSPEQISSELNRIWNLSPESADIEAAHLNGAISNAGAPEGSQAATFLMGVALEKAGRSGAAHDAYQSVLKSTSESTYAYSMSLRDRLIGNSTMTVKQQDEFYSKTFAQPDKQGWFLETDHWAFENARIASARILVALRSDQLSFRFFQFLRNLSPFSPTYAYLFIFLALTLGARLVTLPLYWNSAKTNLQVRGLKSEIQTLQYLYSSDPVTLQQRITELYKQNGVNIWGGCLVLVVDLVFVIWTLLASNTFKPQLVLDGASFWQAPDVTNFSLVVAIAWAVLSLIQSWISISQQPISTGTPIQLGCGALVYSAAFIGIAKYYNWPTYIFIFWALLSVLALIVTGILTAIVSARDRGY
jgi:YidC/Oxa1 family membrane protein insertase